jgi:uncharacterized protein YjbI with pentapeptide repeats
MQRPSAYSTLHFDLREAPRFKGSNLRGVRITARLDGADFSGADLSHANIAPYDVHGDITITPRNVLNSCNFSGARMTGAVLTWAQLRFSRFAGTDLRGVDFTHADLSGADLSGADVSGADFTNADLYGVQLAGVKGLETARGLELAINLDKAQR